MDFYSGAMQTTPHSTVCHCFAEIETIYRADQVLLLERSSTAPDEMPGSDLEDFYCVNRNSLCSVALESSPTHTSKCSGSTTHCFFAGLQNHSSFDPTVK